MVGFNNILNEFNPLRLIALTTMEIWTEILSSSNVQERHLILLKIKANLSFHIFLDKFALIFTRIGYSPIQRIPMLEIRAHMPI